MKLGRDELMGLGMQARETYDRSRWVIGDIARVIVVKWGYEALDEYARKIGIGKDSIQRYKEVAQKYEQEEREEFRFLSWTHFRSAAAQKKPKEWLKEASDNEWSAEKLQVEIKKYKAAPEPVIIRPRLMKCDICHKYYVQDQDDEAWCNKEGKHYD